MTASFNISLPSSSSQTVLPRPLETTNTLAVTSLPKTFFHPQIIGVLRTHFEAYGEINQWVPLPTFGRIIVVFVSHDSAELAKTECDPIILRGDLSQTILRVYRADPNPLVTAFGDVVPQANYLRPPEIEKNFLISPPADDLIAALKLLKVQERGPSVEVLMDPEEAGVGVYVEDCDRGNDDDWVGDVEVTEAEWVYGQSAPARTKWRPAATAMPPISV
ncbi:hypothetical protein BDZ89DRAFT_1138428 [Hymenopellis radicata]|nr:hypothetical protein BDZ89DRAFT_1138428 [Hymenopellis radicata]